jgi:hypothetical protein
MHLTIAELLMLLAFLIGVYYFASIRKKRPIIDTELLKDISEQFTIYNNLKIGDKFESNIFDNKYVDISVISEMEEYDIYSIGIIKYSNYGNIESVNRFIKMRKKDNILVGKSLSWELLK